MDLQADPSRNHFSQRRSLNELLHLKDGDDSGCIEGKVFMVWPPRNRLHRIKLEVVEQSILYRFEVEVPHREGIAFRPHERVCVALKGIKVHHRKESSAPHYFPIVLRFPDGVTIKYLSGTNAGRVIDTWEGNTDEWYDPGRVRTISDAVAVHEACHSSIAATTCPSMSIVPRTDTPNGHVQVVNVDGSPPVSIPSSNAAATRPMQPTEHSSTERSGRSYKAKRKKRKLLKEKESMSALPNQLIETEKPLPADGTTTRHEQPQMPIHTASINASGSHTQLQQVSEHINRETFIPEDKEAVTSRKNHPDNTVTAPGDVGITALQLKAGICTQRGDVFSSLAEIQKGQSMINVIAIVKQVSPVKKTSTDEWCRSMALTDPSNIHGPRQAITVKCFQKKYSEWLPQVQKDDIVILRKLKVVEYKGNLEGIGYGDKLRWAIYDPLKHSVRPPKKGNAPEKELTNNGMGYEYSPYWEPSQDSTEIEYCRKIAEWWNAMRTLEGEEFSTVECSEPHKQHLLISEASPDLPPMGFFNCTVEVLQKFNNPWGATTIYVTDYTANALCNMWDSAMDIAKLMNPGEYWYLYNIRAKWNPDHYMESTMQLAEKVTQLDETKLEVQPHLRALLARKKEFELNHSDFTSGLAPMHVFPEMLFKDVEENMSFLTCIVELLYMDLHSRDGHFLYVTDYTYNSDLPTIIPAADWAHNLEHRVVKIKLDDAQARISLNLALGSLYIIRNMRIRRSGASGGINGCLGGDDTLIVSLSDLSTHQAQQLQRNKDKWKRENMLNVPTIFPNRSCGETDVPLKKSSAHLCNPTPLEGPPFLASIGFKVLARVVDFFPFSLEDACVLRCTNCKSRPPPPYQRCPSCDDMMETHCKWFYCLYIMLQDEKGSEYIVSLSEKECMLLQDVNPSDFHCDQVGFHKFLGKLDPILGNLRDVHLAWSRNEDKAIETPRMVFTLESWNVGSETGYGLLDYYSI